MSQPNEELNLLIANAKSGSKEVLGQLLARYVPGLIISVRALAGRKLLVKIEDSAIVQETLIAAFNNFSRFHGSTHEQLLAWLTRISKNRVLNIRKKLFRTKRDIRREVPITPTVAKQLEDRKSAVEQESVESKEEKIQVLSQSLGRLPHDYQSVVTLHGKEGLAFKEVADRMERSEPAVRKLWGRAIRRCSKEVKSLTQNSQTR